jgi:hypothetical protein
MSKLAPNSGLLGPFSLRNQRVKAKKKNEKEREEAERERKLRILDRDE